MRPRFVLALVAIPAPAFAAGFEVLEHGAAATGMVGAFTAKADDASAVFYNPAGLADQPGWQAYVGSTVVTGAPEAQTPGQTNASIDPNPLPTMYGSYGITKNLAAGIGVFTQFGLSIEWPSDWAGRFLATKAALRTVTINPSVAWRPMPWLAIGGGIDIPPASVSLERAVDFGGAGEGSARFAGNTVGVGGNVGVMIDVPYTTIGISYRSQYNLDFNDGALQVNAPPELASMVHDTSASSTIPLPDLLSMGVSVRPRHDLSLVGQVDWTNWSRFQQLAVKSTNAMMDMSIPQNWHDGWTARLGAELKVGRELLHAGVGYDWNPVPSSTMSPILPDSDRFLAALGGSHDFRSGVIGDLSLMGVFFRNRTSENPTFAAHYENFALLVGLSLEYRSAAHRTRR